MVTSKKVKKSDVSELVRELQIGDVRALARVISYIEDGGEGFREAIELLFPLSGKAFVVGVTGSPGAGKSTLVDQLVSAAVLEGKRVAVLAVDPTSPFSGGALLGDRIRMGQSTERSDVFVRSMAARGALGGVAPHTSEVIFALDAAGYDLIIVETVGVGQSEVEIVKTADTVVVVLVPGMGDSVQILKAGILEIADIFTINKSDYSGVDRLEKDLKTMMALGERPHGAGVSWKPPIVRTVASEGKGVGELLTEILRHKHWAEQSGEIVKRRDLFLKQTFERHLSEAATSFILEEAKKSGAYQAALKELSSRHQDPCALAEKIVRDTKRQ